MSIGELVNLYRQSELIIRPEFQRLFRWGIDQKSRLIESLLLGIPLPSIFVMQREDGVWEVIDGLQRLSTILEFMGELRDEAKSETLPASALVSTAYLPSLQGLVYGADDGPTGPSTLTPGQRLSLKRAKIDVKILLPESDDKSKYELFDRLNAGGSVATSQEIRNAQLIMRDASMFEWIEALRINPDFQATLAISDRLYDEGYDAELVCRYLVLANSIESEWRNMRSMDDFLSEKLFEFTFDSNFDRATQASTFGAIFSLLNKSLADESFRRYDAARDRFLGGFSVSAFESITVGLSKSVDVWQARVAEDPQTLVNRVCELWESDEFRTGSGSGIRASTRVTKTLPFASSFFAS
ncbi:uncharacterized protein DUF262 [Modestobacter roseus]|uniref:Uncharacterized protein DUF262 n=2 Tax=Modestobacter roseus TaxID=1181884 RepID=A0A562ITD0_9ACTN|nr:uncharacterized protein DUF262 [Modestobacter roseus]